ncbi:MAG: hypothetical protein [Caudoviricetes sp.]|nr:MAG: hypothetical protein [Caudoviricetes sp.]
MKTDYSHDINVKFEIQTHTGWTTIFHREATIEFDRPNIIPFRKNLKAWMEKMMSDTLYRWVSMQSLNDRNTIVRYTFYKKGMTHYEDSFTIHINMKTENWEAGFLKIAEELWK